MRTYSTPHSDAAYAPALTSLTTHPGRMNADQSAILRRSLATMHDAGTLPGRFHSDPSPTLAEQCAGDWPTHINPTASAPVAPVEGLIPPTYPNLPADPPTTASKRRHARLSLAALNLSPRPFTQEVDNRITYFQTIVSPNSGEKIAPKLALYQTPEQRAEALVSGMLVA